MAEIYADSVGYTATIVRLGHLRVLPGLDRLRGTHIQDAFVLVSSESVPGDLGLFFRAGTQLSAEYLSANNLYKHPQRNRDPNAKGMFEDNGRVKAVRLKGHLSTGFWMPLISLREIDGVRIPEHLLSEGVEFNSIGGVEICRKYLAPSRTPGQPNEPRAKKPKIRDRVDTRIFAEHPSTIHLAKVPHIFTGETKIWVSEKVHGTSWRHGIGAVRQPALSKWRRAIAHIMRFKLLQFDWAEIVGSRRVIKAVGEKETSHQAYYGTDVYSEASRMAHGLKKGEVLYGELIGWAGQKPIQKGYSYSLPPGTMRPMIYRITNTNEDGQAVDLSYPALRARCEELGLPTTPHIFYGTLREFANYMGHVSPEGQSWGGTLMDILHKTWIDRPSVLDPNTLSEGIVVTVEGCNVHNRYKVKSPRFLEHEDKMRDSGEADMEEQQ